MAERKPKPSLIRRATNRLLRPYVEERRQAEAGLLEAIHELHGDLGRAHAEISEIASRVRAIEEDAVRASQIGRLIYDREPENRRRLAALRASEKYELAFSEPEPLVSILIPTYTSFETLRDVALPSVLSQTYANLEVIVVGDAAPPETAEAIAALDDPRISYRNRTYRGPYPEDRTRRWYVVGSPPLNEGLARARGRWIGVLGDDDAYRPGHVETLLAAARQHRWEHCYGLQLVNFGEGEPLTLGRFPPELGQWGLQAALYHGGLSFFESELSDAIYLEPNDWSICRRMLRAGVRIGMVDEIVVDKHESRRSSAEAWNRDGAPEVD